MNEELKVVITAEIDKFKKGVEEAKKELQTFKNNYEKGAKNADKTFKKAGQNIGKAMKAGCKVAAAAIGSVATAVGGLATASIKGFAEYEQLVGGVEKLFDSGYNSVDEYTASIGKSTESIKAFQKANGLAVDGIIGPKTQAAIEASYKSLGNVSETVISNAQNAYKTAGISANDYMAQITSFSASLISSLGGDTAEAARIGDMAIRDMADNANTFGSSIGDIQNAYSGFSKQNYTMLDNLKLGYGGTKEEMERLIKDANAVKVAMGGTADLTIDSYADVVEAIHLVQQEMGIYETTLNEAEGTISGSIEMTKSAWENLMTGLADGNANIPELVGNVISSATSVLANIIPAATQVLQNIPVAISEISPEAGAAFQTIVDAIMAILPTLQTALQTTFDLIVSAINFVSENTGLITGIAVAIGTVVAAIGLYNAVAAIKAAMDAAQVATLGGLIAAQAAQAAATIAAIAPYVLIAAVIAGLIAVIVHIVKNWDEYKEKVKEVAGKIKEWVSDMAGKVGEWFGNMGESIKTAVGNAKEVAVNKFNEIKSNITEKAGSAYETAKEKFSNLKNSISNNIELAKSAVSTKFGNIYSTISTKVSDAFDKAKEKFDGIKKSISDAIESAKKAVSDKIEDIKEKLGLKGFSWSLPKPSLPKFSVSGGEAPWGFLGQGSLPKIKISWNALGGVFNKPTVFGYNGTLQGIGEAGAEAVIPLHRDAKALDLIASRITDKMGLNTPIVLTIDGKVFAQTSIESINQLTRQTGKLALNIV